MFSYLFFGGRGYLLFSFWTVLIFLIFFSLKKLGGIYFPYFFSSYDPSFMFFGIFEGGFVK